ncbi:hypothetical protein JTE90_008424 [Oedothorax gibbosus]|uniref:Fork-head domain-containing protein n=1 Tax=Oedothorax gibbosus TaxID=931172 RepID=A0AAV6UT15_9ARAC|nr:hypothetical protein JTE90_008424 [Oedothorax gibbosus]
MDSLDPDPGFEPQTRARSNTWPLPRPDNYVDPPDDEKGPGGPTIEAPKKNSSRRNAWGNMSYADLITQAIQSSPEKRLTLAQIYEWMVQNVAYFKDKGDSNSSAGWKALIHPSIRERYFGWRLFGSSPKRALAPYITYVVFNAPLDSKLHVVRVPIIASKPRSRIP